MALVTVQIRAGSVIGVFGTPQPASSQVPGDIYEQRDDSDPEVVAFMSVFKYPPIPPTPNEAEQIALQALAGTSVRGIDPLKLIIAKAISDEAYRLGVLPGALTGPQLQALRARIAAIYKAL